MRTLLLGFGWLLLAAFLGIITILFGHWGLMVILIAGAIVWTVAS